MGLPAELFGGRGGRRGGGKSPMLWQVFSVQMANSRRFMQSAITASRQSRCLDCGKHEYKGMPSPRLATEEEIQELLRAKSEKWD